MTDKKTNTFNRTTGRKTIMVEGTRSSLLDRHKRHNGADEAGNKPGSNEDMLIRDLPEDTRPGIRYSTEFYLHNPGTKRASYFQMSHDVATIDVPEDLLEAMAYIKKNYKMDIEKKLGGLEGWQWMDQATITDFIQKQDGLCLPHMGKPSETNASGAMDPVDAGYYALRNASRENPEMFAEALRLMLGKVFGKGSTTVLAPEGMTAEDVANMLADKKKPTTY